MSDTPMGIQGLLGYVGSASQETHISAFAGKTLAVDAYCWLHRGAFSCATELVLGQPTDAFLGFAMKMVRLLQKHGVTPLFVFDGTPLPAKARTQEGRSESRLEHMSRGKFLLASGQAEEARKEFGKAVSVTPRMCKQLIHRLRQTGIKSIVAPYEADAQLTFLVEQGHAAAAITEDSDLLAYHCPIVLYKLAPESGYCREFRFSDLKLAQGGSRKLLFDGTPGWADEWHCWESSLFTDMCILSGCDYLAGFPGVGLKTAHGALREHRSLERAAASLSNKLVPRDQDKSDSARTHLLQVYLNLAGQVQDIFKHATVWDPVSRMTVPLRPGSQPIVQSWGHLLGAPIGPTLAIQICEQASHHPSTLEPFGDAEGSSTALSGASDSGRRPSEVLDSKNVQLKGIGVGETEPPAVHPPAVHPGTSRFFATSEPNPKAGEAGEAGEQSGRQQPHPKKRSAVDKTKCIDEGRKAKRGNGYVGMSTSRPTKTQRYGVDKENTGFLKSKCPVMRWDTLDLTVGRTGPFRNPQPLCLAGASKTAPNFLDRFFD